MEHHFLFYFINTGISDDKLFFSPCNFSCFKNSITGSSQTFETTKCMLWLQLSRNSKKNFSLREQRRSFCCILFISGIIFFYGVHQSNYQESSKKPLSDESCDFCLLNMSKYKMLHKNSTHSSTPTLINSFSSKTTTNL